MRVTADRFSEFFNAVYGFDPFPWQNRLAIQVIRQDGANWPECLALPTGAGKTTCIDIALFALACQADLPPERRTAPRRIIFVVDRRVIVDEAFEHSIELAKKLACPQNEILHDVASALRHIAGHDAFSEVNPTLFEGLPLTCHQLRGGMYRDDAWARTPAQPCVIASTVDQIGSRLLFRSYGRSNKAWPVHAGLAGNDSLIILDEAHCANPFLQTMQWINRYRGEQWAETPVTSPFKFVVMSATPPTGVKVFPETRKEFEPDLRHPVLGRRLSTSKPAELVEATSATGKKWQTELAIELVRRAISLVSHERLAIAVLVNRVVTAKLVDELFTLLGDDSAEIERSSFDSRTVNKLRKDITDVAKRFDHAVMTGRMRSIDKEAVAHDWLEKLKADPRRKQGEPPILKLERPVFITATQSLEVGANLDFDGMVSECASLDALRQRFGRLNRVGRWDEARGIIVIPANQASPKEADPVYGDKLANTWTWLNKQAEVSAAGEGERVIDFGIAAMDVCVTSLIPEQLRELVLYGQDAPIMLPTHVDCWVQTSPKPEPSPDVALFLHGPKQGPADVQVCWRADIDIEKASEADFEERFLKTVAFCPPTSAECLPVPLQLFRRWIAAPDKIVIENGELSDVDAIVDEESPTIIKKHGLTLVWRGLDENASKLIRAPRDVSPGDTVVIPSALLGWEDFGHIPVNQPIDVGDTCQFMVRRRPVLRLHPELLKSYRVENADAKIPDLGSLLNGDNSGEVETLDRDDVFGWLENAVEEESLPEQLTPIAQALLVKKLRRRCDIELHPFGGIIIRGPRLQTPPSDDVLRIRITSGETFSLEDDTASEATAAISLEQHLVGVANHVARFAISCGLPPRLVDSLTRAAELHDLGKADPRFQTLLHGGNELRAKLFGMPLAKSQGLPVSPYEQRTARKRSRLPDGFRHELLSLQIIEHANWLSYLDATDMDLVLYLVSAHHGNGRPFAPVVFDELLNGPSHAETDDLLTLDVKPVGGGGRTTIAAADRRHWRPPHLLSSGVAERFWKMVRRYGWWGLAWLEAIFVLSDHRESEYESTLTNLSVDSMIIEEVLQ